MLRDEILSVRAADIYSRYFRIREYPVQNSTDRQQTDYLRGEDPGLILYSP